jgi:hypothetical protein
VVRHSDDEEQGRLWRRSTVACGDAPRSPVETPHGRLWRRPTVACGDAPRSPVETLHGRLWRRPTVACGDAPPGRLYPSASRGQPTRTAPRTFVVGSSGRSIAPEHSLARQKALGAKLRPYSVFLGLSTEASLDGLLSPLCTQLG